MPVNFKTNEQYWLDALDSDEGYISVPWRDKPTPGWRYYFDNPFYSYSDAICTYTVLRKAKPKVIIEVGSGHSSNLILDVADNYLDKTQDFRYTSIDPGTPKGLYNHSMKVESVNPAFFYGLWKNDILFIDSSHGGPDVDFLFKHVLPLLNPGVLIHFHDIYWTMEYPEEWRPRCDNWNEIRLLKDLLEKYPLHYQIEFCSNYLTQHNRELFEKKFPLCLKNEGGSIWIRKIGAKWHPLIKTD